MSDEDTGGTGWFSALSGTIAVGDGRVARGPHGAVVVRHDGDAEVSGDVLARVAGSADDDSAPPDGRALMWSVAELLASAGTAAPSVALVAVVDDGVGVLVAGACEAVVRRTDAGPVAFAGQEAVTWVDRLVTGPVETIELGSPEASVGEAGAVLGAGVIEGDRLVLAPAPDEPEAPVSPEEDVSETGGVIVSGVLCENGHFNHPAARYCRIDGVAMFDGAGRTDGERPALGVFVLGDGSTFTVEADSVLGRDPSGDGPTLRLDHDTVAPDHADVILVGWDVTVRDRGTGYATWHWPLGGEPQRVEAGQSVTLAGGDRLALGHYELRFESHHV